MSFRIPLRPLAFSAILASAAVAVAWTRPAPPSDLLVPIQGKEGDDLEGLMKGIEKNFDAADAAIEKKDAATAMDLMTKIEQSCITAKTMTPPNIKTVEDKDKPAFQTGYRKQILTLLKSTADMEMALADGDFDKAKKVADDIDAEKKAGHDAYKKMPRKKKD